jgi:hypothetical protein
MGLSRDLRKPGTLGPQGCVTAAEERAHSASFEVTLTFTEADGTRKGPVVFPTN